MLKNILLLGFLTWVGLTYAKHPQHVGNVAPERITDSESYRVEKALPEQEAARAVAGSKIKKQKVIESDGAGKSVPSEADSEVRYWQYSE